MMKKILIGIAALAVLVIGAVLFTASNLDGLVKTAIEKVGSNVAGVAVTVSKVSISIKEGKASIEGLTIANPKGFVTANAIVLGNVSVALETASVTKSPIIIQDVSIVAPQVTYELSSTGGSNIDAIKKNVDLFTASKAKSADAPKAEASSKSSEEGGSKLVIDKLSVTGGKVTLATPIPGGAASVKLGDITLNNIGKSSGGASAAEVAAQLLDAVSNSAIKGVSSLSLGAVTDVLKNNSGGAAIDQIKGLLGK